KHLGSPDVAGGAATVLDDHRLSPLARELIGKEPPQSVSAAASGVGNDDAHGPRRILRRLRTAQIRSREPGESGQSNQAHARSLRFAALVSFPRWARFVKSNNVKTLHFRSPDGAQRHPGSVVRVARTFPHFAGAQCWLQAVVLRQKKIVPCLLLW